MDETASHGHHNTPMHDIKYESMGITLFLAIRRQFNEMIDESEERMKTYIDVKVVRQDINWYKVNTDDFLEEKVF